MLCFCLMHPDPASTVLCLCCIPLCGTRVDGMVVGRLYCEPVTVHVCNLVHRQAVGFRQGAVGDGSEEPEVRGLLGQGTHPCSERQHTGRF